MGCIPTTKRRGEGGKGGQKIAPMLGNQGQKIALLLLEFLPGRSLMEVKMHDP